MPITKIAGKKKDGLQAYRVRVNYTDQNGNYKRIERYAYGMAEAKEVEQKLKELSLSPTGDSEVVTLNDLVQEYLSRKNGEIRKATSDKSASVLRLHVQPMFGAKDFTKITVSDVAGWKAHMNELGLAVSTKNKAFSVFRALLNYAKKMHYISENPVSEVGRFRDPNFSERKKSNRLQYYTTKQWLVYAPALQDLGTSYVPQAVFVFFCIAYYTGMRKGEINALKWSDIDGNVINITRSITQKLKGIPFEETAPKNETSYRSIQIPTPLQVVLAEHKLRQMLHPDWTEDYRVCGGHKPLADSSIDYWNRRAAEAANLPRLRVHDFRHSHASLLINEGINIQEVARRLGHADVKLTWNIYGHLYPQETERALAVLNRIEIPAPNLHR